MGRASPSKSASVARAERGNFPVVGPNGVGYIDVIRNHELTFLPRFERRPGGVSIVAHSGALLEAMAAASFRAGGVGLNLMISAGNEAVTDMADYLDFLVDDEDTKVIALAIEKIRRPEAFFAAAVRARVVGKPIVAIKLGRTGRGQVMTQSHTGTVTSDAWAYDVAFRQAGIATALEVDELVDRVQFLEQLPKEKWTPLTGLGVLTGTGGFATMTADLSQEESIDIPDVPELKEFVTGLIPSLMYSNPLDATGVILANLDIWDQIVTTYSASPELDAMIFLSQFAPWDTRNRRFSDRFAATGATSEKPFLLSPLAGHAGEWMEEYRSDFGITVGNGLRGTLRGLQTMARFIRGRSDGRGRQSRVSRADGPPDRRAHRERRRVDAAVRCVDGAAGLGGHPGCAVQVGPSRRGCASDRIRGSICREAVRRGSSHRSRCGPHRCRSIGARRRDRASPCRRRGRWAAGHSRDPTPAVRARGGLHRVDRRDRARSNGCLRRRRRVHRGFQTGWGTPARHSARPTPTSWWRSSTTSESSEAFAACHRGIATGSGGYWYDAGALVAAGRRWIKSMDLNPLIVTEAGLVAVDCVCFLADPEPTASS